MRFKVLGVHCYWIIVRWRWFSGCGLTAQISYVVLSTCHSNSVLPCSLRIKVKLTSDSIGNSNNDKRMTTPVKCESYEGEILKEFNKPYLCGLITLALLGCQSEDSTQEPVSVLVPYNINELPKPNDGYGYDDDGTITVSYTHLTLPTT